MDCPWSSIRNPGQRVTIEEGKRDPGERGSGLQHVLQGLGQPVLSRISVAPVLAEDFGMRTTDLLASLLAPLACRFEVLVHAMLAPQPLPLGGVALEHLQLRFEDRRGVDGDAERQAVAEEVMMACGTGAAKQAERVSREVSSWSMM
jgi:hypothetical protein